MTNWKLTVRHETPVLPRELIITGINKYVNKFYGFNYDYFKFVNGNTYLHSETTKDFTDFLRLKSQKEPEFLNDILKDAYFYGYNLIASSKIINKTAVLKSSKERIIRLLDFYCEAFEKLSVFLLVPVVLDDYLTSLISEELEIKLGKSKQSPIFKKYWFYR